MRLYFYEDSEYIVNYTHVNYITYNTLQSI